MKNPSMFNKNEKNPASLDIWSALLPVLFYLVCGLLLILLGNVAIRVTAYVLGGLMICCGAWRILTYFRSDPMKKITGSLLATGLAFLLAGILLTFNPDYLDDLLPFVWGLALLYGAFLKIEYAFDEKALKIEKWWILLILAAFSLAIGVITLLNPDFLGENRELIIGIMLVAEAVLDIVVFLLINNALKKLGLPTFTASPAAAPAEQAQPSATAEGAASAAETAAPADAGAGEGTAE